MVQPSPYTPGQVSREVAGRDKQLAEIGERLSYMTQLQRLVGRIRVAHRLRGVGKTSLLRRAQQEAEGLGAVTVWVTAGGAIALIPAVAEEVGRVTRDWDAAGRGRVRAALEHLEVKVTGGVPGVASVEATWRGDPAGQSSAAQRSTREFEDLVVAASAAAGERGRRGVVLLVDEIQAADSGGLRTLSYARQHFQSERPDLPAAILAAGLPDSVALINQAVSNSERFAYRKLDDLTHDAALMALASPAAQLGVTWDDAALEAAVEYAAGYPPTLQLFGDNTWRQAGTGGRGGRHRGAVHRLAVKGDQSQ